MISCCLIPTFAHLFLLAPRFCFYSMVLPFTSLNIGPSAIEQVPLDSCVPTTSSPPTEPPSPTATLPSTGEPGGEVCQFCPVGTKISKPPDEYIYTSAGGEHMTCGLLHYKMKMLEGDERKCDLFQEHAKQYCCSRKACPLCPDGTKPTADPHKYIYTNKHGEHMTCGKLHKKATSFDDHAVQSGKCANVQHLAWKYCCRSPYGKDLKRSKSKGHNRSKSGKHAHKHVYKGGDNHSLVGRWYDKETKAAKGYTQRGWGEGW